LVTGALLVPAIISAAKANQFDPAAPWVVLSVVIVFVGGRLFRDGAAYLLAVETVALGGVALFLGFGLHIEEFHEQWGPWIGMFLWFVLYGAAALLIVAWCGIHTGKGVGAYSRRLGRFVAGH
jgi:hypothetical protein